MANETVTRPGSVAPATPNARQGLDILVADDDPIFRSLLASRLRRLDGEICEAVDGSAAWTLVRERLFDLAIIDFDMPGLDGCNLARCLRTHPRTRHIPIVMCTARTDNASMQEAIEAGVSSFLIKPVNWSLFETHVRHLLSMSRAAHEAQRKIDELETRLQRNIEATAAHAGEMKRQLDTLRVARENAPAFDKALAAAISALRVLTALAPSRDARSEGTGAVSKSVTLPDPIRNGRERRIVQNTRT